MDLETTPLTFFAQERIDTIGNNCTQKIGFSAPSQERITPAAVRLDLPHLQPQCTLIYTPTPCSSDTSSPNRSTTSFEYAIHEKSDLPRKFEPILRKQVKVAVLQHEESKANADLERQDRYHQSIATEKPSKLQFSSVTEEEDLNESDTCDSPCSRDSSLSNADRSGSKGLCLMGHELKNERPERCKTCAKRLVSLQKYAVKHNGRLISQDYSEKLNFECEAGHSWTCSYKSARKRWCPHCRKQEKVQRMNQKEQMLRERENQNRALQEELFAKARIQAQKETPKPTESVKQPEVKSKPLVIQAQQNLSFIEQQTEQYARIFAEQYMKKSANDTSSTFEQAFMVYKLLFVADNYFQLLSIAKNQDEVKAFYRNTLRLLHPDKNKHPDSAKTFQKVHSHYKKYIEKHTA